MKHSSEKQPQEVLAGLVERVTYHNAENGFWVLRAKARGHRDVVTVVGHAAAIVAAEWITASSGMIRGIGPAYARKQLRAFVPKSCSSYQRGSSEPRSISIA